MTRLEYDFKESKYDKEYHRLKDVDIGNVKFTDTKFMTADDKTRVAKQFKLFVQNGFKREDFSKRLYEHLHLHCGFIAHDNIGGFYNEYFNGDPADLQRFISHFIDENGNYSSQAVWGKYEDIGKFMADILKNIREYIETEQEWGKVEWELAINRKLKDIDAYMDEKDGKAVIYREKDGKIEILKEIPMTGDWRNRVVDFLNEM